jgi:hypothetical protein
MVVLDITAAEILPVVVAVAPAAQVEQQVQILAELLAQV